MNKHHRFTGRELTTLLEQVRAELGAEATIVEANKVRSGGIAGFFTNEEFEVIAKPSFDDTIDLDDQTSHTTNGQAGLQLDLIEPAIAAGPAQHLVARADERDTVDIRTSRPVIPGGTSDRGSAATAAAALLERIDTISITDRIGLSRPPVSRQPTPQAAEPAAAPEVRFGDILTSELEQTEELEQTRELLRTEQVETTEPSLQTTEVEEPETIVRTANAEDFWSHLEEVEMEIEPLDLQSRIVTIVGNRSSALSVARRIEASEDGETRAILAVTEAPDKIDLPACQQVENAIELGDRLRFWQTTNRIGIVIVDADFGADAATLVERVREAGSRVVRLAIDDELSPKRIFDLIQLLGGNVVIDVTFRAAPAYVLSLADRGVPLASVDGHPFDANLLLALNREVQRG